MFGRNNLNRNGFFFHLLSEKENPIEKPMNRLFYGNFYLGVNNVGLKINSFLNLYGSADYKGFDVDLFVPGSQIANKECTYCVVATNEDKDIIHPDIVVITEQQYIDERNAILEAVKNEQKPTQQEISELKEQNAQLILALVESGVI